MGQSLWEADKQRVYGHFEVALKDGLAGTRTQDQCLKRALLYQLSYQPAAEKEA
jgi:hypothetical protein